MLIRLALALTMVAASVVNSDARSVADSDRRSAPRLSEADRHRYGTWATATSYIGSPDDYCFSSTRGSESGNFAPGVVASEFSFDCRTNTWLFSLVTNPGVESSAYGEIDLWIDIDRLSTGCESYDAVVFGGVERGRLYVGAVRTPSCDRATWVSMGPTTVYLDAVTGWFALEFPARVIGGSRMFEWFAIADSGSDGSTPIPRFGDYFTALVRRPGDPFVRTFVEGPRPTLGDHMLAAGADFDGDGFGDLVFVGGPSARLARGSFAGRFVDGPVPNVPGEWDHAVAGDFDGDGRGDLVVATGDVAEVRFGRRNATLTPPVPVVGLAPGTTHLVVANFDGGCCDDLYGWAPGGVTRFLRGNATRTFTLRPSDGIPSTDVVVAGNFDQEAGESVLFYRRSGRGNMKITVTSSGELRRRSAAGLTIPYYDDLVVGDWNGDGYDDVVMFEPGTASERIRMSGPRGGWADAPPIAITSNVTLVVTDVNGDGHDDLISWGRAGRSDRLMLGSGR